MKRRNFTVSLCVAGFLNNVHAGDDAKPKSQVQSTVPDYKVLRLGRFQDGSSKANAVNAIGVAAGLVRFNIEGDYRPALFMPGTTPMPIYTDGPGEATGINNRMEIAGWFRQGGCTQAFRWWKQSIRQLPSLGGGNSYASGINNRSEIVGWSEASPGASHAVYWWNDNIVDLGTWGGYAAQATAINEGGDIVGFREIVVNGVGVRQGVCAIRGEKPRLLPIPAGFECVVPTSINERGDITGYVYPANDFLFGRVAFIYSKNKYKLMPDPYHAPTVGLCINNQGDVAGFRFDGNADPRDRGALWLDKGNKAVNLADLPAAHAAGWRDLGDASAINDAGVIVGYGLFFAMPNRIVLEAFMLIPKKQYGSLEIPKL